jgi:hypothetical protein
VQELIADFLAQKRIAVAGVSRHGDQPANANYRKLRDLGYEVFAVNPRTDHVEGDPCYPSLVAIPGEVDAVLIATPAEAALELVRECISLGIDRVWMHRSFGAGSVSEEAIALCREHDIRVIAGGCPMMFRSPVDVAHRCMRWFLRLSGGLPKAA